MNVEREIKRVIKRHIHLINEYPEKAIDLVPCDIINGMTNQIYPLEINFLFVRFSLSATTCYSQSS